MERFINKIDGSENKLDLSTFLRIRKMSVERYLLDNEINSSEKLETFLYNLELTSSFVVSDSFKNEARQLFPVIEQKVKNNEEIIVDINQEQTEDVIVTNVKYKKKKS